MAIKKYYISKDATITNAYESNLIYRATGSNAGLSDTLQLFSIYGQATTSSSEKARILLFLESDDISTDRTNSIIPASGSVNFYLNLYNCEHPFSIPQNFKICVSAISASSWDEGMGINDDEWSDEGVVNWGMASTSSTGAVYWVISGSDYYTSTYVPGIAKPPSYTSSFVSGLENMRLDITSLMEEWMATTVPNYGLAVYLHEDYENAKDTYYIKKFFGRTSEYFFKRPCVSAEWNDSIEDDRGYFYASSSLCDSENVHTIYFYNRIRGYLKNIPGVSNIYVRLYDDRVSGSLLNSTVITGGLTSTTGIYSASFSLYTTSSIIFDRWINSTLSTCYYTGSINVKTFSNQGDNMEPKYVVTMPGLKQNYKQNEKNRFKVFIRDKDWKPTLYSISNIDAEYSPIENMYYRITRVVDNYIVQDYGTGSIDTTKLSYNISGSYFDFDIENLEADYMYKFNFIFKRIDNSSYEEIPQSFKFRVDKESN